MARSFKVWLVDDDPDLREMLSGYLRGHGYEVRTFETAENFLARLAIQRPDLAVLDLMLPGEDGLSVVRKLRDAHDDIPLVILTAKGDPVDRIIGLEQGADDYLSKPFLPRELTARIDSVLRRHSQGAKGAPILTEAPIKFGDCVLDLSTRTLLRRDEQLLITTGEFSLLAVFAQNPHRPLSRHRLIEMARGPTSETDERSMDVQVSRLRKLIELDARRPRYLQTVWGFGYVFVPDGKSLVHP